MAEQKYILTEADKAKLNAEYRDLIDNQRPNVIEALALARSQGDLSENADYDAARDRQAQIEARISEIETILRNSVVAEKKASSAVVGIGDNVVFLSSLDNEKTTVRIAGNTGADPMAEVPAVSNESPLGKALLGNSVGDTVTVEVEEPYTVKIITITK